MINLNLREVLKQTSNLSARKNGSHVDLSYNLEAEIEVICIPEFDQFPFNRHTCHVNVSHKCGNVRPIQPCFKVTSWTKTEDQLIFVANKTLMPMKPPEMILFDYGLTVSYLTGKGSVVPQCPMNIVLLTKAGPGVKFLTVWFQPWRFKSKWHLLCCRFGAQLPHEVDAVTIFPMTYLDFSQVHFLVLHTNRPYRGDLLDLFPSPLHLLSRKVFHQIFKRSLEIFWQDCTSGHRLSASHQHLLWGCQRHSEHQWRA